jgi:hypothetical protein
VGIYALADAVILVPSVQKSALSLRWQRHASGKHVLRVRHGNTGIENASKKNAVKVTL